MATLKRHNGSTWVEIPNGTAFKYHNGTTWVNPNHVKYHNGSTWVTVWSKSDPVTYRFAASNSRAWRPSGWRSATGDLRVGAYNDFGDNMTVYDFTGNDDVNGTGLNFGEAIAIRPTVTSLTVTLLRMTGSGASTTGTGDTWYMGQWDGTIGSGDADDGINTTNMATLTGSSSGPDSWAGNTYRAFTLPTALGSALSTKELWIALKTSGFSSTGGTDTSYSALTDHTTIFAPFIDVTLDY